MARLEIVEGWTGALDFQLFADGTAVNLTGMTVALIVTDKDGAGVTLAGTASIQDAATGKVRYAPAAADFDDAKSPYTFRWRVTDAGGLIVFFPHAAPEELAVRKF